MRRRYLLQAAALPFLMGSGLAFCQGRRQDLTPSLAFATVAPRALLFPRDHGAHPDYRTEWWYLTGWLDAPRGPLGFQVTFFRVATGIDGGASRFAPRQLIIAHAAIADPARGSLLHDERVQRAGFGLVEASLDDTDVRLDRWRLWRDAAAGRFGSYRCELPARSFELDFVAQMRQPLLLQGRDGYSQKGPQPGQASFYYSQPQLAVRATLRREGAPTIEATGTAWLDHEWSSSILDDNAAGWDWLGMNLDDGAALTAFQIRPRHGSRPVHTYASLRDAAGRLTLHGGDDVAFEPAETWRSPRTNATYAVAQRVRVGARHFETRPLMNDQELDSRATTGAVYWEGASELLEGGRRFGRGYLEITGVLAPMRL